MYANVITLAMILAYGHALAYGGDQPDYPYSLNYYATNKFEQFLEKFKTIMKTGNSSLGIPVLDPFVLEQQNIDVANDLATVKGLVQNLCVVGLSNYTVNQANFALSGMKVNISLTWPLIEGAADYNIDGTLAGTFPVYGTGSIKIAAKNLFFAGNLGLSIKNSKLFVKSMTSRVSLKTLDLQVTGLFNDEEVSKVLSAIISDMTPQLIEDYQKEVTDMVNKMASKKVTEILSTLSMTDLISLVG